MSGPVRQTERHVEAVLAALDILECFLSAPELATKDLVAATGFTRNRVMRLAGTLAHRGFLVSDETGAYRTGPKVFALSRVFERHHGILPLVRPLLREIALRTGESATLYVREGLERAVLAREEGTHSIRQAISEGQRMELHAGAAGKVILAYSPPELVETVLSKTGLPRRTATTITSKPRLMQELKTIRACGYGVSFGERAADAVAVAVPVLGYEDELVGALAVAGPVSRFTPEVRQAHAKRLQAVASKLRRRMGLAPGPAGGAGRPADGSRRREPE
jgi:IclR family transcriptional regulator, KDG regulon repressor